jgi:hypothetical protein
MQYIQLQGQVAADLDTPLEGGFNLFIDTADGTIKAKDSEGNISSTGGGGIVDTTYSELYGLWDDMTLTAGTYYKITDFKTCYDQPDFDVYGSSIQVGNYRTGSISPIIVFALDSGSLASDAFQPQYPNDNIKYDISFNETEVTDSPAFGRITYRKDDRGNAFDYDFREVLFKRYDLFFSEQVYEGTISIEQSGSFGFITGSGTSFENFETGDNVGVLSIDNQPLVNYYEIVSIEDDYRMVVTGSTYHFINDTRLLDANLLEEMSWKQNNIPSSTIFAELPTFADIEQCFSNTSVNNAVWNDNVFLLPNNVFKGNDSYINNSFGTYFINNTFYKGASSNIIRDDFYNNVNNDFHNNTINDAFYNNIIDCDFENNIVNGEFYNNHFGNDEGAEFDYNTIQSTFYNNFYTGDDNFEYNLIKGSFYQNIIRNEFSKNTLNEFYDNVLESSFNDNIVGDGFYGNKTYGEFRDNVIGSDFYDNTINIEFSENSIGGQFELNTIGSVIGEQSFNANQIGYGMGKNLISGSFTGNKIGYAFVGNEIGDEFSSNTISSVFAGNDIGVGCISNIFGDYTTENNIGNGFAENFILNDFSDNTITNDFKSNKIGNEFTDNMIGDGFGFGGSDYRGNVIGNDFTDNIIGEYFYDNNIGDRFTYNRIGNDFQYNRIETELDDYDFTTYLGVINAISSSITDGTDGVYPDLTGSTGGFGSGSVFEVTVASSLVSNIAITNSGNLYEVNDTITITSGSFGGTTDLVLTVTELQSAPMVYGNYNKTIQRRFDGTIVLTALDDNNQFYITQAITEPID